MTVALRRATPTSYQPRAASGRAVSAEHRRHFGVGDTGRLAVAIDDAAAQPRAAIGDRNEMLAVRLHVQRGNAAEGGVPRGQLQAAAKFEIAEPDRVLGSRLSKDVIGVASISMRVGAAG